MTKLLSPGKRFKTALEAEFPLQIMGTVNAYCAIMAKNVGFQAIYVSGAGCANASYGLSDVGMTSLDNVLEDVRRITSVCDVPLLVDMDTGWGTALNISRSVAQLIKAGAAAAHIEDQVFFKRCGHLSGKELVALDEMVERIQAANTGKTADPDFYLIARTDALATEGMSSVIERSKAYLEAGADAIFAEAFTELSQYKQLCSAIDAPVLANITEFGKTPLFTVKELASVGVKMVLYPLTAFRAMNQAALNAYQTVRTQGTQSSLIPYMQDRKTLYDFLNYDNPT